MLDERDDMHELLEPKSAAQPTVLIVDDDALVLSRLKQVVTSAGYDVRTAGGGAEALDVIARAPPSIVITDLNMPAMNGLELCRRIRAHEQATRYVYIIVLTMRDRQADILAGLDAGANDFLSKRTPPPLFIARLRTANHVLALEYSLRNALEEKTRLAMTDELTGAYNRRYFLRHFNRELKDRLRFGGHVSLLLLDIDHFKKVNDIHGHGVGDSVLKEVTWQIGNCLRRETDWCARLGGEEFVVVLGGTTIAEAAACAERIRQAIADHPIAIHEGSVRVTVTVGVSGFEETIDRVDATAASLLEIADRNLYAGKTAGRNRVALSIPGRVNCTVKTPDNSGIQYVLHAKPQISIVR